jgi:predicted membrane channel-forming protein YqfA (hemolysin III family)
MAKKRIGATLGLIVLVGAISLFVVAVVLANPVLLGIGVLMISLGLGLFLGGMSIKNRGNNYHAMFYLAIGVLGSFAGIAIASFALPGLLLSFSSILGVLFLFGTISLVQRVYRWFVPVDKSEYVNVLGGNWKTKHPALSSR